MILSIERDMKTGTIELVYLLESTGKKMKEGLRKVKKLSLLDQAAELLKVSLDHFEYRIRRTRSDLMEIDGDIYKVSNVTYEKRSAAEIRMMMSSGYWD